MTTLDLVKKDRVMSAIVIKLEEADFRVIEATNNIYSEEWTCKNRK